MRDVLQQILLRDDFRGLLGCDQLLRDLVSPALLLHVLFLYQLGFCVFDLFVHLAQRAHHFIVGLLLLS